MLSDSGWGCWQDEDHIGRCSRISRSCHPLLASTRTIQKCLYLYQQELQKVLWCGKSPSGKSWDRAEMDQIDQFDLYFLKRAENQIELNLMVVWCSRYIYILYIYIYYVYYITNIYQTYFQTTMIPGYHCGAVVWQSSSGSPTSLAAACIAQGTMWKTLEPGVAPTAADGGPQWASFLMLWKWCYELSCQPWINKPLGCLIGRVPFMYQIVTI